MTPSDPLDDLLARWQPLGPAAPDPAFTRDVWTRLRADSAAPASRPFIPFPVALPLAASLAICLGVATAVLVNRSAQREQLAANYARSIDPLQLVESPPHPDHH